MKSVAAGLALLALASWAGPLHPAADALAVLRVPLLVLAALAVIWTSWPRRLRWPVAGLCLLALGQVGGMKLYAPAPGPFVVYQKNLWGGNPQAEAMAAEITAQAPDVVTLQEVSTRNRHLLDLLRPGYPHQYLCAGVAVLSRHPVVQGETLCVKGGGLAGLRVSLPEGPVWVLSVHLFWPWPHDQRPQAERIEALVTGLPGPVVLAGDFNMTPWGSDVRRLVRATGVRRAGPMFPTFWLRPSGLPLAVPLPLDQVYATGGGAARVRPLLGSDHAGVLAGVFLDAD
ncbi:endonuclease/exonuclease/phosphatase family protein [Maliponia aquimaris]|uniref:endonuclease/exonuclease/phosphatase family protein n=1 Tax=Maliponia aquimaris TaxID=1673631 RepID=UPI0015956652|nr:endonuclease/exonuclease/phosphatase family protein [Maliponia aquimaris]